MRVLSLSQPWLWSIDSLPEPIAKRIENRSWRPPAQVIADREPIALHAAQSWDADAIAYFIKLGLEHPQRRELYERGVITSVVEVPDVIDCGAGEIAHDDQQRWLFGPFGWRLANVRRLPKPIQWRGGQGLRRLPPNIVEEINDQLAGAA